MFANAGIGFLTRFAKLDTFTNFLSRGRNDRDAYMAYT